MAFLTVLAGAVPLGPVNLAVVQTTVQKSIHATWWFIVASGVVELLFAITAIYFGMQIQMFLSDYAWVPIVIFSIFIIVGIIFLLRKPKDQPAMNLDDHQEHSSIKLPQFFRGLIISLANPQVILFWIFAITFISGTYHPNFNTLNLSIFLSGVFLTKILVLVTYARLGNFLKSRLTESAKIVSRTLGVAFLLIGVIQLIKIMYFT